MDAVMNERVDGAFWVIGDKTIPAPRQGDWEIRQAIYRSHGYQLICQECDMPNKKLA